MRIFLSLLICGMTLSVQNQADAQYLLRNYLPIMLQNPYYSKDSLVGNWHPSVVYFPNGWGKNQAKFWMAWTPNKVSDNSFENPCIAYSNDGIHWDTTGLSNPVVDVPRDSSGKVIGYNADPALFYSPLKDTLYLIWKCSDWNTYMKQTGDGFDWGSHDYRIGSRVFIGHYYFNGLLNRKTCPVATVEQGGKYFFTYARMGPDYTHNWGFARWTMDSNFNILDTTYFYVGNNPDSINSWHFCVVKDPLDHHYYLFTDGALHNQSVWDNSYMWVAVSEDTLGKVFDYITKPLLPFGDYYKVTALFDSNNVLFWWGTVDGKIFFRSVNVSSLDQILSIDSSQSNQTLISHGLELFPNFPNPFNPTTHITYYLQEDAFVNVSIYNGLGQCVRILEYNKEQQGNHSLTWDGIGEHGTELPTGMYLVRIEWGSHDGNFGTATQKVMLLR